MNRKSQRQAADMAAARAVPKTVRLDEIRAADWNVHQADDKALAGLAASMRANGLIQRVTVRWVADAEGGAPSYEVIDGHRRVAAARSLGWAEIAADVVADVSDEAAQLMTATANVQRVANDPLLESALIGRLRDAGRTYAQIAAAMGTDERHVARRARLLGLTAQWRELFARAGGGADMADMMEIVARHEPEAQDAVFAQRVVKDRDCDEEGGLSFGADELEAWFEDELRTLDPDETPFDVAGCAQCACNTKTHGCLFPEFEDGCGRCQDAACFARMWNGAVDAEIEALRKRGVEVRESKERWNVPRYWEATPHRERKNVVPYVYGQDGLKRLAWTREDEAAKAAPALTEAEKAEAKRVKAAHRAWQASRDGAFAKIRSLANGDAEALARRVVAAPGFEKAATERYVRAFGGFVGQSEAMEVYGILGGEALGLTAEEDAAMSSEDPALVAEEGGAE